MSKATIISGPKASGKTWIAQAIINQYRGKDSRKCVGNAVMGNIDSIADFFEYHSDDNMLMFLFDGCTDLSEIEGVERMYGEQYSLVFTTQLDIKLEQVDQHKFHLINCNNKY